MRKEHSRRMEQQVQRPGEETDQAGSEESKEASAAELGEGWVQGGGEIMGMGGEWKFQLFSDYFYFFKSILFHRVTNHHCLSGIVLILIMKVLHPEKSLSHKQT